MTTYNWLIVRSKSFPITSAGVYLCQACQNADQMSWGDIKLLDLQRSDAVLICLNCNAASFYGGGPACQGTCHIEELE